MTDHDDRREAYLPPLPLGRLRAETLVAVALGRDVHIRTGPWVPMREDDSRLLRVLPADERPEPVRAPAPRSPLRVVTSSVTDSGPAIAAPAATEPVPVEPFPVEPEPFPVEPEPVPTEPEPVPVEPEPVPTEPEPVPTAAAARVPAPTAGDDEPDASRARPAETHPPVPSHNRRTARRLARGRDPLLGRLTDAIQRSAAAAPVGGDEPTPGRAVHVPAALADATPTPTAPDDERWDDLFAPRSWTSGSSG